MMESTQCCRLDLEALSCEYVGRQLATDRMVAKVEAHPAWQGDLTLDQIHRKLEKLPPFVYALSKGMDQYHFFLTYVDSDKVVKSRNIRMMNINERWVYKNGCEILFNQIQDLIPHCLKCSASALQPALNAPFVMS